MDAGCAQDHSCTNEAIGQLCLESRLVRIGILRVQHVSCTVESLLSVLITHLPSHSFSVQISGRESGIFSYVSDIRIERMKEEMCMCDCVHSGAPS